MTIIHLFYPYTRSSMICSAVCVCVCAELKNEMPDDRSMLMHFNNVTHRVLSNEC